MRVRHGVTSVVMGGWVLWQNDVITQPDRPRVNAWHIADGAETFRECERFRERMIEAGVREESKKDGATVARGVGTLSVQYAKGMQPSGLLSAGSVADRAPWGAARTAAWDPVRRSD